MFECNCVVVNCSISKSYIVQHYHMIWHLPSLLITLYQLITDLDLAIYSYLFLYSIHNDTPRIVLLNIDCLWHRLIPFSLALITISGGNRPHFSESIIGNVSDLIIDSESIVYDTLVTAGVADKVTILQTNTCLSTGGSTSAVAIWL